MVPVVLLVIVVALVVVLGMSLLGLVFRWSGTSDCASASGGGRRSIFQSSSFSTPLQVKGKYGGDGIAYGDIDSSASTFYDYSNYGSYRGQLLMLLQRSLLD